MYDLRIFPSRNVKYTGERGSEVSGVNGAVHRDMMGLKKASDRKLSAETLLK